MSANSAKPRNIALDAIKGICIILMVIGHSGAPRSLTVMISSFHMPAFFIISGFLFKERYVENIWNFIKRKMTTIWWPFVFWTLVFLLLHNVFADIGLYKDHYSASETAVRASKGIMMRQTEQLLGGFWFLTSLLFASIASLLYYRICGMKRVSLIAGICGSLVIAEGIVAGILPEIAYFNPLNFQATAFFMTGTLMARENFHEISNRIPVVVSALASITIGTFWIKSAMNNVTAFTLFPYFITASLITWGLLVVFWKLPQTKPLTYLVKIGSRTLDILIFHFIAFKLVTWVRIITASTNQENLSDFPVVDFKEVMLDPTDFYWIAYTIAGLAIPLLISVLKDKTKEKIRAKHPNFRIDIIP